MAVIIDGKAVAAELKADLAEKVKIFKAEHGVTPTLAVIIVGDDPASQVYVRNKERACNDIGFDSMVFPMPADVSEQNMLTAIGGLNNCPDIHGILVQLPLPKHLDEEKILLAIDPAKDVDAFHPYNVGKLMQGNPTFLPCTPAGVMELLKRYGIDVAGKECVIVGRSNIVGKPLAMLMLQANGTVTICHSKTKNLKEVCKRADILICAIGKPKFFDITYIKDGAAVVDVGINRDENGKLCGDVDFEAVKEHASYITPVPGGVGPCTIAMLMQNTFKAACNTISSCSCNCSDTEPNSCAGEHKCGSKKNCKGCH